MAGELDEEDGDEEGDHGFWWAGFSSVACLALLRRMADVRRSVARCESDGCWVAGMNGVYSGL